MPKTHKAGGRAEVETLSPDLYCKGPRALAPFPVPAICAGVLRNSSLDFLGTGQVRVKGWGCPLPTREGTAEGVFCLFPPEESFCKE